MVVIAILNKILTEVQASNKKVAALEKQDKELKGECSNAGKKKKVAPSPEVRVSLEHVCVCVCVCIIKTCV